jgi:RNA polymerase sigma-70 factor (ECF subfamily)
MDSDQIKQNFIEAYEDYSDDIFRFCYYKLYFDRELAKDFMQKTYTKTWDYLSKGKKIDNLRAFLYKTARNLIIDYHRKNKEDSLDSILESGVQFSSREQDFGADIDQEKYKKLVFELDEKYQEAVMLRYIEELQPQEIAEIVDASVNTISVRIHRGLKKLRNLIEENE